MAFSLVVLPRTVVERVGSRMDHCPGKETDLSAVWDHVPDVEKTRGLVTGDLM